VKCIAELRPRRDIATFFTDAQTKSNKQGVCVLRQQQNAVWVSVLGGAVSSWRWVSWEILSFAVHVDSTTEVHTCPKSYTFVAFNVDSTLEATHRSKTLSLFCCAYGHYAKNKYGSKNGHLLLYVQAVHQNLFWVVSLCCNIRTK
jgi:hypothetical protein